MLVFVGIVSLWMCFLLEVMMFPRGMVSCWKFSCRWFLLDVLYEASLLYGLLIDGFLLHACWKFFFGCFAQCFLDGCFPVGWFPVGCFYNASLWDVYGWMVSHLTALFGCFASLWDGFLLGSFSLEVFLLGGCSLYIMHNISLLDASLIYVFRSDGSLLIVSIWMFCINCMGWFFAGRFPDAWFFFGCFAWCFLVG